MNIASGDILNYNSMICLNCNFLVQNANVNSDYLRVAKSRAKRAGSKDVAWKFIQVQGKDYFIYNNIPEAYRMRLPEIEIIKNYAIHPGNTVQSLVSEALSDGFRMFTSQFNTLSEAQSAAVLHSAKNHIEINRIPFNKSIFFEQLANEINLQGVRYLPKSWRNLRDKIRLYVNGTDVKEIIIVKNKNNANAAKIAKNDALKGLVFELATSEKNYSAAHIYRKINLICNQSGIDNGPSLRWVSGFMAKSETKNLIHKRYGSGSRFNHQYRSYVPTQTALYAGDAWQIDGTRVNIIDHKATFTDKDGKRKTVNKYLYIVAIRDVMSGLPLGWEYCYEENAQAVINALATAVRNAGYLPYELIYDRFPGHNTQEWSWIEYNLRRAGTVMTVTHKAEGKAHMERWFGTLQDVFMAESDLYYGEGVRSTRRHAHRSKEYVAKMRQWAAKNNFDFDAAIRETDRILEMHNQTPYNRYSNKFKHIDRSPEQLHDESDKPNTNPISEPQFCYLFGLHKEVSIRNYMIQTQIENATYYYGIDDCEIVDKYTGEKLINCFDPEDLSRVHLFDGTTFLGTFAEVPPAQRFGPNKDMRAVGKMKKIAADNEAYRAKKLREIEARQRSAETQYIAPDEENEPTSEVGLLLGGRIKKHAHEAAETAYLREMWETEEEEILNTRDLIKY
ncbi:MAG: transposase family protein [Dysgonamonadaceae bacterium]|nr:transposase family protein [Dysgonamonadaceae bacterium]